MPVAVFIPCESSVLLPADINWAMAVHNKLPDGWKVLSSEYLHQEEWLTVRRDSVQIASGHVIPNYFVLEYPDWVNVIAITKDKQFVLVRQFRYAIGEKHYELCAGVRDKGDKSPMEAARRELLEETGYGGGNWKEFLRVAPNPATSNNWTYSFLAVDVERQNAPSPEASEEISVHLFSLKVIAEMLDKGEIVQATHLAPLYKYLVLSR